MKLLTFLAFVASVASAAHPPIPVTEINRIKPVPGQTTVLLDGDIEMADGKKVLGNPDAASAGLNVGAHSTDPSALVNGDVWYNSTGNALKARISGATISLGSGGGGGSVTSVSQTFTGGIITVGGSPVTGAGTLALTVAGTPGGVPYFSSSATWGSSGALTLNGLVLGGGAGGAPKVSTGIASNGSAQLQLGVNATTSGSIKFFGSGSGDVTMSPNAIAGTAVALTLPANSGTLLCSGAVVTPAQGGTGLAALGTALQTLRVNAAGTALEYAINSAAASALTGDTLAAGVLNSSLARVGTLLDLNVSAQTTANIFSAANLNLNADVDLNMAASAALNMSSGTGFILTAPHFTFSGATSGIGVVFNDALAEVAFVAANGMTLNGNQLLTVNGDGSALTGIVVPLDTGTTGTLAAPRGGTGLASYTVGDLLYANTATSLAKLADVATGNALISGGIGVAPSWGKIGLATHVSGVAAVGNGGTGVSTSGTTAQVAVGGGTASPLVWTTATGTGAPVRADSPTLVTPALGTPTSGDLAACTGFDFLRALVNSEVSITTTATLTSTAFGKMHVCTGTAANYTVNLPAVAGNTGKIIGVRMANALTKLVTLDAAASELIDGELTRPMWAQESAVLLCDGTGWVKLIGKTRPMQCSAIGTASTSIPHNTATKVGLATLGAESLSGMLTTASSRITAQRKGTYFISALVSYELIGTAVSGAETYVQIFKNGAGAINPSIAIVTPSSMTGGNTYSMPSASGIITLNAGDFVELFGIQTTGVTMATRNVIAQVQPNLVLIESSTW